MAIPRFTRVDGVDYSPDGIEELRSTIITYRGVALDREEFSLATQLTHVAALLAYLAEVVEWLGVAANAIPALMTLCTCSAMNHAPGAHHYSSCPLWRES